MYCSNCGNQIPDGAQFCSYCGQKTSAPTQSQNSSSYRGDNYHNQTYNPKGSEDRASIGLNILSFFIPIVGFVLYFQWKQNTPQKAQSILISAIVGFISGVVLILS